MVKELKAATGMPAAASFKHVSPAGAAVGYPMSDTLKKIYFVDDIDFELTPLATAYARARGTDRMCSYGDFCALSDTCDEATARLIKREVSDGVIAPDYTPEALEILKSKRKGTYCVIKIDPNYVPDPIEHKQVFGITFEQGRNNVDLNDPKLFEDIPTKNKEFTPEALRDLKIALITLKYTQSNSVCYAKDGQAIGIGAGQQSRIHCTRLAGSKADEWWMRQNPKVLNLPFKEHIHRADRDNCINVYLSEEYEDILRDGVWQQFFTEKPEPFLRSEQKEWIAQNRGVALGSDASATTLSVPTRAAWSISHRPAVPSATTMSLRPATNTASPWPSLTSDCSTINTHSLWTTLRISLSTASASRVPRSQRRMMVR